MAWHSPQAASSFLVLVSFTGPLHLTPHIALLACSLWCARCRSLAPTDLALSGAPESSVPSVPQFLCKPRISCLSCSLWGALSTAPWKRSARSRPGRGSIQASSQLLLSTCCVPVRGPRDTYDQGRHVSSVRISWRLVSNPLPHPLTGSPPGFSQPTGTLSFLNHLPSTPSHCF